MKARISRQRRGELARLAKRLAGEWLHADTYAAGDIAGLTEAEDDLVRDKMRALAYRLITQGKDRTS